MLKVSTQNKFVSEKKYIFDFVFSEILFIDYQLVFADTPNYVLSFEDKSIVFADSFFSHLNENHKYYNDKSLIPNKISKINITEFNILDLPVIYGTNTYSVFDKTIELGIDIVASIFFMLSRWEEIANTKRDSLDRFEETESLSIIFNFYQRPIVNEYIDLIKCLINKKFSKISFLPRLLNVIVSTDVDFILRYDRLTKISKALIGDLFKRKSFTMFKQTINDVYDIKFNSKSDVFDTFDFLMNVSEQYSLKSRFYFIPSLLNESYSTYNIDDMFVRKTIDKILTRNHIVGIHPSFNSYLDNLQFEKELHRLQALGVNVTEGRQHLLCFKNPNTWQLWDDNNLKYDSSLGFHSHLGFRSGICYAYPVYNLQTKQVLSLREQPLICMDSAVRRITNDKLEAVKLIKTIVDEVKKYGGDFTILWHNSNLTINEWLGWDKVYMQIIENACSK